MASFKPYCIRHIQLEELNTFQVPEQNTYLICWINKVPVADAWLDSSTFKNNYKHEIIHPFILRASKFYGGEESLMAVEILLSTADYPAVQELLRPLIEQGNLQDSRLPVSVIICTRNRPSHLKNCLEQFERFDPNDFELIIVDNAPSTEESCEVVKIFPFARYIRENRKGLDIARNTGIRYSTHSIIAFTDDDVLVPDNWIINLQNAFNDPLTMAVTGLVLPAELDTKSQYIFEKEWSFNKGFLPRCFDHAYFLSKINEGVPAWEVGAGANMAFRKEAFQLAGQFDERLDVGAAGCSGDSEMWYRIMAEGFTCRYMPSLYVTHVHRKDFPGLRNQLYNYMKGHACALLIQYDNFGFPGEIKRLNKTLPLHYYYKLKKMLSENKEMSISLLIAELLGIAAGKKYYKKHMRQKRHDIFELPVVCQQVNTPMNCVAVIIACYNHGEYLPKAIESVLSQSNVQVEIIVVDDGSTDDTALVCHKHGDKVKYVRVERVGLSAARNIGIQFTKAACVVFLDADDYLLPDALNTNLSFLQKHPSIAYVSGGHIRIDGSGKILKGIESQTMESRHFEQLLRGNYIAMEAAVIYRRELFPRFHFDTSLKACEDYDLNLRISQCYPVVHHSMPIAAYLIHPNSMSSNSKFMLEHATKVLRGISPGLSNADERSALKAGLKNWENYYGEVDPDHPLYRTPSSPPAINPVFGTDKRPQWSVMIPAYNCGAYLQKTIESVLAQDQGPDKMQIEVVDDASTDIDVEKLVYEIGGGRVHYYRQDFNRGSLRNFETCINRANGKWIHLLHGDDYTDQGFYTEVENMFTLFPSAGAACTGFTHVNGHNEFISESDVMDGEPRILEDWLFRIALKQRLQTPAVVVKREVYENLGSFFGMHYGEDWEMWIRIAANYPVAHSSKKLAHYRVHDSNISSAYFASGQNMDDVTKIIEITNNYLPVYFKKQAKRIAKKHWSKYFAATTDLTYGRYRLPQAALVQARRAFALDANFTSAYFYIKTLLKVKLKWKFPD